jgi:hypothetical protein
MLRTDYIAQIVPDGYFSSDEGLSSDEVILQRCSALFFFLSVRTGVWEWGAKRVAQV